VRQLSPEAGVPHYVAGKFESAAYGLNDALRLCRNCLGEAVRGYGRVPTRPDRFSYVVCSGGDKSRSAPKAVFSQVSSFR
jgi:hypothetical protein